MSPLNHSPASVRYLKARLRILKRPAVWGSAAILLLTLFSVYTLLQRPDWLTVSESDRVSPEAENATNTADPNALPPEEDSAIGMDIDSLSVLRNEISNFDEEAEIDLLAPPSRPVDGEDGEAATSRQTGSPLVSVAPQSSQSSQFSSAYAQGGQPLSLNLFNSPTLLPGSSTSADSASAGASNPGFGLGTTSQATPPANPLRSAVEQYANSANQSTAQAQTQTQADAETASGDTRRQPAATPTYLPPQPVGQYAPQTSPIPGTTGYTIPPSLIYGRNSTYTNPASPNSVEPQAVPGLPQAPQVLPQTIPAQPGIGQPLQTPYGGGTAGGTSPVPNVQQPQVVQPPPQPFSVPRTSAGYSIGGREVETFSNP
jgi:hypothetical protein